MKILIPIIALIALTACGQKGDLYQPNRASNSPKSGAFLIKKYNSPQVSPQTYPTSDPANKTTTESTAQ